MVSREGFPDLTCVQAKRVCSIAAGDFSITQLQPSPPDVGDEEPASSSGFKIAAVSSCCEVNVHPNVGVQVEFQLGKDSDAQPQRRATGG